MVRAAPWVAVETGAINHEHPRRLPPRTRLAVFFLMIGVAGAWLATLPGQARAQAATVLVTRVDGTITPVIADHLVDGVAAAERDGHAAYLVELDTPGGLDTSMREIVQAFLGAEVPVVVYVTPAGARAASAGAIITFAAHVAAMTPGTTIGAATPVDLQGGEITDKVINDAAAFAETVAAPTRPQHRVRRRHRARGPGGARGRGGAAGRGRPARARPRRAAARSWTAAA